MNPFVQLRVKEAFKRERNAILDNLIFARPKMKSLTSMVKNNISRTHKELLTVKGEERNFLEEGVL
jgi:hypothetical protein